VLEPKLIIDYRIGGIPQYYIGKDTGELMKVPPEVKKCVAFICCKTEKGMEFAGTAFFASVPFPGLEEGVFVYLVTAKHIVEGMRQKSLDQIIYVRMNKKNGGADFIKINMDLVKFHPSDPRIDVAVIQMPRLTHLFDLKYVPLDSMVATDEIIEKEGIDIGDEVFLVGLFTMHYGSQRNIPIVRVGNIAQMPEEPIVTKAGPMEAYLIEARSIGGISGSPVFVRMGGVRERDGVMQVRGDSFYLLGLMYGHWDLEMSGAGTDTIIEDALISEGVNMGIAVVVPAQKIMEAVNQEELVELRKRIEEQAQQQRAPTPDDVSTELTEEEFRDTLKKVSRPEEAPPDQEKTET